MSKTNILSLKEMEYIRFYMGDPEIVNSGRWKGGPKAYNTINALLHSGIQNEIDKIHEGRVLEIEDIDHLKSYIDLSISIYHSAEKYGNELSEKAGITYRVDRESTMSEIKGKDFIEGFYSTCKWGFLEQYAHIKEKVALIKIVRDETVPFLDFEELFEEYYAKPEEAEVLIPFRTKIEKLEQEELSKEEMEKYTDMNGSPPFAKYTLYLSKYLPDKEDQFTSNVLEEIYKEITSAETIKRVQDCLYELSKTKSLNELNLEFYVKWKEKLQHYIYQKIV